MNSYSKGQTYRKYHCNDTKGSQSYEELKLQNKYRIDELRGS
jgi:hypothetical protein